MPRSPTECEEVVVAITDAVADAEGCDPDDLDPLYETIDPNALDALFDGRMSTSGLLVFEYHGYTIVVHADGRLTLRNSDSV